MSQYSLSVLCHFVALADCTQSGYVGGQLVITRNMLSFSFSVDPLDRPKAFGKSLNIIKYENTNTYRFLLTFPWCLSYLPSDPKSECTLILTQNCAAW